MVKNYYKILGLNKAATEDDIKKAYKKMALKFHPDKNKESDAEERFKEIAEAYEVLSDNKKKYKYDNSSRRNSTPNNNHSWSFSFRPTDPFDLFKNFFNGVDPFSEGFHDSLFNLHRQHHNSIFGRDPFFSQSRDFPDTPSPFKPRNIGNVPASSEVKTETSYKTGQDGTVHITRTVIGKDGSVSKEFRFRSTSCQNSHDEPKNIFHRQTSEPVKNNDKLDSISETIRDFPKRQQSETPNTNTESNCNSISPPEPFKETNFDIIQNSSTEPEAVKTEEIKTNETPLDPVNKPSSDDAIVVGHLTRKKSEKILEDLSNLVLKEAESLDEELSSLPQPGQSEKENNNEKENCKVGNILQDQLSAKTTVDDYKSVYDIEAEVVKEKLEKSEEAKETDPVSTGDAKSSLSSELPANSFYQTSVPSPLAKKQESQGGSGDTNSMLDFCLSRAGSEQGPSRAKNVYKFQPQVRKPSLVRNRKKSYKRSKSYAGGTVSLSQCPLCARLFERSVIEEHAAGCPGLCDTSLGEETTDRPTCPLCGQRFSRDKLEQHSQYCGEVAV